MMKTNFIMYYHSTCLFSHETKESFTCDLQIWMAGSKGSNEKDLGTRWIMENVTVENKKKTEERNELVKYLIGK